MRKPKICSTRLKVLLNIALKENITPETAIKGLYYDIKIDPQHGELIHTEILKFKVKSPKG